MGIKCGKQKYVEESESALDISLKQNIPLSSKKSLVGKCRDCRKPNTDKYQKVGWCHPCNTFRLKNNFYNWSSGNEAVDYFIQETQLNAKSHREILEWIPYESIDDVEYIAKGGYGTVFLATWKDGYITHWDKKTKEWARNNSMTVTVKSIDNSANVTGEFFHEIRTYLQSDADNRAMIRVYGITQDPQTLDFMIVSEYANHGNLRSFLVQNHRALNWERRLRILLKIAMALQDLHQAGFVHKDFHSGNILQVDEYTKISDLGLCRMPNGGNILCGVLPYVAPEVLLGGRYTPAADIYSLAIIMWEVASGIPPFSNRAHDRDLLIGICNGIRPPLLEGTPKSFTTLIERCWNSDPENRPNIHEITGLLFRWHFDLEQKRSTDTTITFNDADTRKTQKSLGYRSHKQAVDPAVLKIHPEAHYTSRPFNFIDLRQTSFNNRNRHDSAFESATRPLPTSGSNKNGGYNMMVQYDRTHESNYIPLPQVDLEKLRTPSMAISGPIYTELLRKHYRSDKMFYDESQNDYIDNDSENSQTISPDIAEVASTRYSEILSAELVHRTPGIEKQASRYSLALVAEIQRRSTPKLSETLVTTQSQLSKEKFIEHPEKKDDQYSIKTINTRQIRRDSISSDYKGFNKSKYKRYNSYQDKKAEMMQEYLNSTNKYHNQTMEAHRDERIDDAENPDLEDNDMLQYICKQATVQKARRLKIASYPNTFITRFEHNPTPSLPLVDNTN